MAVVTKTSLTRFPARWWLAGTLLMVLLFLSPALSQTFIFRDAFNLFYPYKAVAAGFLRHGAMSLWNPYETLGSSFVGELSPGWFYPGNVLYLIFPAGAAFRLFIVGHFLLAALFMWLWLRSIKIGPEAAAVGALSYTLSGYVLTQNGMPDMLASCAWLPGSLWLCGRWLRRRSWSALVLVGASLAMPFLAGRAEGVLLNGLAAAVGVLLAEEAGPSPRARAITLARLLPVAGAFALVLAAAQFLPSYELGRLSIKGQGLGLDEALHWSFHPARLLEFFLPSPWGRFWLEQTYFGWDFTGWPGYFPWSLTMYLGWTAIIGALIAAARAPRRALVVGALLALAILFALGRHLPLYPFAYRLLPIFRIFRYPEKFMVLAVLILSAAGANGWHYFLAPSRPGSWKGRALAAIGAIGAGLILYALYRRYFPLALALHHSEQFGVEPLPEHYFLLQFLHPTAVGLALVLLGLALKLDRARRLVPAGLILLTFLDLSLANAWVIPYADPKIYQEEPAALALLRADAKKNGLNLFDDQGRPRPERFRVMHEPEPPPETALFSISGATRFERYRRYEHDTVLENFNFILGLEHLTGYTAAATADFNRVMSAHLDVKTMELFNVRYVISPDRGSFLERASLPLAGRDAGSGFKIFALPAPFPRAYLIGRSVRVSAAMDHLDRLATHDFRSAVVLEDDPALPPARAESELALAPMEASSDRPEAVTVRCRADADAYLVLSDSYFPGWKATVDGRPAPIFRANFLVRAVRVPAGEHEVVFSYRPWWWPLGGWISLLAAVLAVVAVAAEVRGRDRRVI